MVLLTWRCYQSVRKSVHEALRISKPSDITVQGWLRSVRKQKSRVFGQISDGLSPDTLQLVFKNTSETKGLAVNSFLEASGQLVPTPDRPQPAELHCHTLHTVRPCDTEEYPFPSRSSPDWDQSRQHVQLRSRLPPVAAVLRARAGVTCALHEHLAGRGYLHVHTPVLTSNDCEGAGEVFTAKAPGDGLRSEDGDVQQLLGKQVFLTVSGQLHLEAIAGGVSHVYCLGPAFRAENSRSRRHLAEFYMLEAEMAPASRLSQLTEAVQQLICDVTTAFLQRHSRDMELIAPDRHTQQMTFLERLVSAPFVQMTYAECASALTSLPPGGDLSRQHELALLRHTGQTPLFVTHWPKHLKPFYVKHSGETAEAVDLLVPGVGELVGGSVREDDYQLLHARLERAGLLDSLGWYADLRRYGSAPTAGYGLGLERLLLLLTGLTNVRDVIPFPRWSQHCST